MAKFEILNARILRKRRCQRHQSVVKHW
jgi:hypothetical protein